MKEKEFTLDHVDHLYEESPSALKKIASYKVRNLPPEKFKEEILRLANQQPSNSITNLRDVAPVDNDRDCCLK